MTSEIQFDRWKDLYAGRVGSLRSSAIRDLLSVTARPDIISLAGGLPNTKPVGYERVASAVHELMRHDGAGALQYGPSEGHRGLKRHVLRLMAEEGIHVESEDLILTQGAQQALELTGKIFLDPGDVVVVEAPSYVGALQAFAGFEPQFVMVPVDNDGMVVDSLEDRLQGVSGRVKFIYTVPNFQNPAGVTLSLERRRRLLEIANERDILVVEDNPYGRLRFEGEVIPSLRSMDEGVIYISTFSKIFSPGMRLGWIVAPRPILEKVTHAKQAADLCSSSFTQMVLERYFSENLWEETIKELCRIYKSRRNTMLAALEEHFPDEAEWTKPQGGFFVWAGLPDYIDTGEMLAEAIREKVAYVPGSAFYPDGSGTNSMRLAFCYPEHEEIEEGIKRLGKVIKRQMKLYRWLSKT